MSHSTQLQQTLSKIDALNNEGPIMEELEGHGPVNKEVLYSQRMQARLNIFQPEASEALQIAAYCQHVKRWAIPRSDYPMDRPGYKKWRTDLAKYHAATTAEVMRETGYETETIERVEYLLQKKGLKRDAETQALEDVICLVFLEHYFEAFAAKHSEEKIIGIVQKTWRKMSESGHSAALSLPLPPHLVELVKKALNI